MTHVHILILTYVVALVFSLVFGYVRGKDTGRGGMFDFSILIQLFEAGKCFIVLFVVISILAMIFL